MSIENKWVPESVPGAIGHVVKVANEYATMIGLSRAFGKDKAQEILDNMYAYNAEGYRSEEFTDKHDGKHVLFAGCSQTFGIGVFYDEVWAKKVYDKLSEKNKLSGYFNLGIPGGSIQQIGVAIVDYISKFGIPDVVVLNLPDPGREYWNCFNSINGIPVKDLTSSNSEIMVDFSPKLSILAAITIEAISRMVPESYIFSWDTSDNVTDKQDLIINPKSMMSNYYSIFNELDTPKAIYEYKIAHASSHLTDRHAIRAFDSSHAGWAEHGVWSEFVLSLIAKNSKMLMV